MSNEETDTQRLPCKLTQPEREAKDAELVQLVLQENAQKADKKAKVSEMNGGIKETRARIDQLAKELDEGTEVREVQVRADYDYEAKRVSYVRTDTGDEISSREMDSFDLQENLPSEDLLPPPAKPQKRTRKKKHGELNDIPDSV